MITGVGIDLIEVKRLSMKINKDSGFKELIFSKNEIEYCESKTNKFQHYAARFAAKEAFFKALGTGWMDGTSFNEVEITNDPSGKPTLTLLNATQKKLIPLGVIKILVSLTHLGEMASAVVIIENNH